MGGEEQEEASHVFDPFFILSKFRPTVFLNSRFMITLLSCKEVIIYCYRTQTHVNIASIDINKRVRRKQRNR